jgi:hypothetical protein
MSFYSNKNLTKTRIMPLPATLFFFFFLLAFFNSCGNLEMLLETSWVTNFSVFSNPASSNRAFMDPEKKWRRCGQA